MEHSRLDTAQRYRFGELLGAGAAGNVYAGVDLSTSTPVALKQLRPELVQEAPEMLERFRREGEALRSLNHPNIVKLLDVLETDAHHVLVMEYVAGGSLRALLDTQPQLPLRQALEISLDLADALTRAHRLGIIHRDLKPANVLLAADGTPRLSDFGIAHFSRQTAVTQQGGIIGTYAYMAPEIYLGEAADARLDIWAFGVMLFEMLAGQRPFQGQTLAGIMSAVLNEPCPDLLRLRPDLPEALVDLVSRMLVKYREERISSVRLVGAELEQILSSVEQGTSDVTARRAVRLLSAETASRFDTPTPPEQAALVNFPRQTTPFVGRLDDLARIEALLADASTSLVTVLGPGGLGKTRLSMEAAARWVTRRGLNAYFVPLAPLSAPNMLIEAVGQALEFTFTGAEPREQLINYFKEKSLLLVLDNFEHLIEGADLVADIVEQAPGVKVLATSRTRLNLQAEQVYELRSLHVPPAADAQVFEDFDAVQMFIAYARRAQPGFKLAEDDRPHVLRIVQLVDGMPLGIELAAAWARALNTEEIAAELAENIDFLETTQRDIPARHRSMQAVFSYSWNLLTEDEQAALLKLSVFRGGFTRAAAGKAADASLRALAGLVDKSLLRRDPHGRYEIHELLRQYAERRLQAEPAAYTQAQARHAAYFQDYLLKHDLNMNTGDFLAVVNALRQEDDNIRQAALWMLEHPDAGYIPVLFRLFLFKEVTARHREAAEFASRGIALLKDQPAHRHLYAWLLAGYAQSIVRQSRYEEARQAFEQSLALMQQAGDVSGQVFVYGWQSYAYMWLGDLKTSLKLAERSHALEASLPEDTLTAIGLGQYAYALFLDGQYEEASRLMHQLLDFAAKANNAFGLAYTKNNLGEVRETMGATAEAERLYAEAYDLFKSFGGRRGMAFTRYNLGRLLARQGMHAQAGGYFEESLAIYKDIGDRNGIAETLTALGTCTSGLERWQDAESLFQQSLVIFTENGSVHRIAETYNTLGGLHLHQGQSRAALQDFRRALEAALQIEFRDAAWEAVTGAAAALLATEPERAGLYLQAALASPDASEAQKGRARDLLGKRQGDLTGPLPSLDQIWQAL